MMTYKYSMQDNLVQYNSVHDILYKCDVVSV